MTDPQSTTPASHTVTYQMKGADLARIYFSRAFFKRRSLFAFLLLLVAAVLIYSAGHEFRYGAYFFLGFAIIYPWIWYRKVADTIAQTAHLTCQKTLTYDSAGTVVAGPGFKSEQQWTWFKGFSEDAAYFYLHLSNTGMDSVVPKSAFTPEQQEAFRTWAQSANPQAPNA
jgi:hypothetical protein